jgi:hypothetical protein
MNCPKPEDPAVLPFRIGIAPAATAAVERAEPAPAPDPDILPPDLNAKACIEEAEALRPRVARVGDDGPTLSPSATAEEGSGITWPGYIAWRATKSPVGRDPLVDLDQATHEFVGEVAELGELFLAHGPAAFYGERRAALIDAIGDILFCGCRALDAWGRNPLSGASDLEFIRIADEHPFAAFAEALASRPIEQVAANPQFMSMLAGAVFSIMLNAQTSAGLTANACKERVYQGREQDIDTQVGRILRTLVAANEVLTIANSSVGEALAVNMRKLDARDPGGRVAGDGDRLGAGR